MKYPIYFLILLLLIVNFNLSYQRVYKVDEFENLYASWLIFEGSTIYKDFWQIHTPLLYFIFSFIFNFAHESNVFYLARYAVFLVHLLNSFLEAPEA